MKRSTSKVTVMNNGFNREIGWELRPGGMLVQKRDIGDASSGTMIKIKVSHGSYHHDITVPAQSTFGNHQIVLVSGFLLCCSICYKFCEHFCIALLGEKVHVHFLVWCISFSAVESLFDGKLEKWVIAIKATFGNFVLHFSKFFDKSQRERSYL
jgi:hypothetical protein